MAKGFFNRILDAVGLEEEVREEDMVMEDEYDDQYPEDEYEEPEQEPQRGARRATRQQAKVVPMPGTGSRMQMLVFQPSNLEDAESIIDSLKARKPVIMNLDDMDVETAQRILDYVGGAVYTINGDIKKVARSIFVVAPPNVDVSQSIDERSGRDSFKRFD
jgi:cell division inhibitor SepF